MAEQGAEIEAAAAQQMLAALEAQIQAAEHKVAAATQTVQAKSVLVADAVAEHASAGHVAGPVPGVVAAHEAGMASELAAALHSWATAQHTALQASQG